jgi:hypothetical protein
MRIYRISSDRDYGYRVCVARNNPKTGELEGKSLYNYSNDVWMPLSIGSILRGKFHVGSKPEYCLAYFAGNTDLPEGEFEVLLTVEIDNGILPSPEEDAYMGTEAIVIDPVLNG